VWIFLFSGLAAVLIAQLTISFQALKAANTDPADALRFE
jgi:ABC-type antimicrobial peptide transport system permease subunit